MTSKKLSKWESFRVLEIQKRDRLADSVEENAERPNVIYLLLCSSRFGQGMWLARHTHTKTRDLFLSKHFEEAIALEYFFPLKNTHQKTLLPENQDLFFSLNLPDMVEVDSDVNSDSEIENEDQENENNSGDELIENDSDSERYKSSSDLLLRMLEQKLTSVPS